MSEESQAHGVTLRYWKAGEPMSLVGGAAGVRVDSAFSFSVMVDVDGDLENGLERGPRCVSLSSEMGSESASHNHHALTKHPGCATRA